MIGAGAAYTFSKFLIEADVKWINWSDADGYQGCLPFGNPVKIESELTENAIDLGLTWRFYDACIKHMVVFCNYFFLDIYCHIVTLSRM